MPANPTSIPACSPCCCGHRVILRRFTRDNVQHPTYKALPELGEAIRICFLCRCLSDEAVRREINDGLNVVEHWNSALALEDRPVLVLVQDPDDFPYWSFQRPGRHSATILRRGCYG